MTWPDKGAHTAASMVDLGRHVPAGIADPEVFRLSISTRKREPHSSMPREIVRRSRLTRISVIENQ